MTDMQRYAASKMLAETLQSGNVPKSKDGDNDTGHRSFTVKMTRRKSSIMVMLSTLDTTTRRGQNHKNRRMSKRRPSGRQAYSYCSTMKRLFSPTVSTRTEQAKNQPPKFQPWHSYADGIWTKILPQSQQSAFRTRQITLISWNIDFQAPNGPKRMAAVCQSPPTCPST